MPASDEVKMEIVRELESGNFSEEQLEVALVIVPELLDPAPFFFGRQLPTDSGPIDLFGFGGANLPTLARPIRECKFPTVFELKADRIRRDALVQVFDYSTRLQDMTTEDIAWHITRHSGKPGSGMGRIWNPEGLRTMLEEAWSFGRIIWKVVIGTSYDPHIEKMASLMEVKLYTVGELCAGYRERLAESHRGNGQK